MRHHTMRIGHTMAGNAELIASIKRQAREHAGRHPGMMVTVKIQRFPRGQWEVIWRFLNVSGEKQTWE